MRKQSVRFMFMVLVVGCSRETGKNGGQQPAQTPAEKAQIQQKQQFDEDKKVVEKRIALLNQLTQEYEKIKDKPTPPMQLRMQELTAKLGENKEELNALPPERRDALLKSFGPQLEEADGRMKKAMYNLIKGKPKKI